MTVLAQPQQHHVEARPGGGTAGIVALGEGAQLLGVVGDSRGFVQLRLDAVDVGLRDGHVAQQRLLGRGEVGAGVVGRHEALVAPEDVDARPVQPIGHCRLRQPGVERQRRAAAGEDKAGRRIVVQRRAQALDHIVSGRPSHICHDTNVRFCHRLLSYPSADRASAS